MSETRSRPNISQLSARLAADSRRVERFVQYLSQDIDRLVEAAGAEDWEDLGRQSGHLAENAAACGYEDLARSARTLRSVVRRAQSPAIIRRELIRLVGVYGRSPSVLSADAPSSSPS